MYGSFTSKVLITTWAQHVLQDLLAVPASAHSTANRPPRPPEKAVASDKCDDIYNATTSHSTVAYLRMRRHGDREGGDNLVAGPDQVLILTKCMVPSRPG